MTNIQYYTIHILIFGQLHVLSAEIHSIYQGIGSVGSSLLGEEGRLTAIIRSIVVMAALSYNMYISCIVMTTDNCIPFLSVNK